MEQIKWVANTLPKTEDKNLAYLSPDISKKVRTFHESFPQYNRTPLAKLDHMAEYLGLKNVFVKDESYRFGLNAFKAWWILCNCEIYCTENWKRCQRSSLLYPDF